MEELLLVGIIVVVIVLLIIAFITVTQIKTQQMTLPAQSQQMVGTSMQAAVVQQMPPPMVQTAPAPIQQQIISAPAPIQPVLVQQAPAPLKCGISADCPGWNPGASSLGCQDGACIQMKKDWAGMWYVPKECKNGPFAPLGSC